MVEKKQGLGRGLTSLLGENLSEVSSNNNNEQMTIPVEKLKPGLTGWAQINGRDEISLKDKVKLEKYYMDNQSLYLDIKIFFLTFSTVFLKSKNISH